jgi:hypothetical protein
VQRTEVRAPSREQDPDPRAAHRTRSR